MRFVRVAVRMMAAYFNSTSETIRWHNSLPEGSLRVWRLHSCCAAVSPRVPALGKLRFDSGERHSYRQCERCKRMPLYVQCPNRRSTVVHQIRSVLFLADVSLSRVFPASSLFQCLVPNVRVAPPASMEVRGEDDELLSFVLRSREAPHLLSTEGALQHEASVTECSSALTYLQFQAFEILVEAQGTNISAEDQCWFADAGAGYVETVQESHAQSVQGPVARLGHRARQFTGGD